MARIMLFLPFPQGGWVARRRYICGGEGGRQMKLRKKLHLEVKCPQKQWLKRLFRSDLVGIGSFNREKERERKKEREGNEDEVG